MRQRSERRSPTRTYSRFALSADRNTPLTFQRYSATGILIYLGQPFIVANAVMNIAKEKTPDGGNRQTLIGKYPFTTMKIPACSYYITTAEQVQVQNAHTKNNLIYYREKI